MARNRKNNRARINGKTTEKKSVESGDEAPAKQYSTKWKKISDIEYHIFAASPDEKIQVFLGKALFNIFNQKWKIEPEFEVRGTGFTKTETFNSEIEAGRKLKDKWIITEEFIEFNDFWSSYNIDNSDNGTSKTKTTKTIATTRQPAPYHLADYSGDEFFSDEEWEEMMSDFSLDGD